MTGAGRGGRITLFALALLAVFRLWLSAVFPITGDEAYFIVWGQRPDWGYYDHPPMIGWILALLARISEAPWLLRLPSTLLPFAVALALYGALSALDPVKARYAALAYLLVPVNAWNVFVTTDTPLVLFATLSGLAWWRAVERRSLPWHALAGALLGLALLSKYLAVLLAFALVADAALSPRAQRPWRGLAVTIGCAVPFGLVNLWWNYQHCWANVMFNVYNRHDDAGLSWRFPLLYLLIVFYVLSPLAMLQLARRGAPWKSWWAQRGLRFCTLAFGIPFGFFLVQSVVREVGLHWVLAFIPFFYVAAALALPAARLRQTLGYLGVFTALHLVLFLAGAAAPLESWKFSRLYDGIVFHVRITDVVRALEAYRPDFQIAADGYSPAVTASYYSGRYVFVFGTASSHARQDDLLTDFRALDGRDILVFRKNPPQAGEYEPYFRSVERRSVEFSGAVFHLVLGRGFDYRTYRERVLVPVRDRYYRMPWFLPQGACVFCERYFGGYCPLRG